MSFNDIDDFDVLSIHSQQSQRSHSVVRNQHLSLAQMRGVIQIFNHYFPKNTKKRLKKNEKIKRWDSYKKRIYREYGRIITGQFASEKALVKRYSEPLSFIKYKLKRSTNLNVNDLSPLDQDYYMEIGGMRDVNELIKKTYNIDSISKIQRVRKRQRLDSPTISNEFNNSFEDQYDNNNHNKNKNRNDIINNVNDNEIRVLQNSNFSATNSTAIDLSSVPPPIQQQSAPRLFSVKTEKNTHSKNIDTALRNLNDKMDIFEHELLDKKKLETYQITKQKLMSIKNFIENILSNEPALIGFIPGIGHHMDQVEMAFYHWINRHKILIHKDCEKNIFIEQIITLKNDTIEWNEFLTKWKLLSIFSNNKFELIWNEIKSVMNITNTHNDNNIEATTVNENIIQDKSKNVPNRFKANKNKSKEEIDLENDDI